MFANESQIPETEQMFEQYHVSIKYCELYVKFRLFFFKKQTVLASSQHLLHSQIVLKFTNGFKMSLFVRTYVAIELDLVFCA